MLSRIIESRQAGRPLALLLIVLFGVVCAWLLARIAGTLLGGGSVATVPSDDVPYAGLAAPAPESLARWHLFGNALPTTDPRQSAMSAPASAENLKLVGLFAESGSDTGVALIADETGAQAAYRVGALLPGGSRLHAVLADHVLLDRDGQRESLRIEVPSLAPESTAGAPASATSGGVPSPLAPPPAAPMTSTPAIPGAESIDWAQVREQTGMDPAELARQVRVLPVIEDGAIVGMRLSGGTAAPMIARLGLQPDDIVTAVNGIPVRDVSRAQDVIASVRDADSVRVTVRRHGREQTLNVDLK